MFLFLLKVQFYINKRTIYVIIIKNTSTLTTIYLSEKRTVIILYFIPQYIEINDICVWKGTKGFGFNKIITPL